MINTLARHCEPRIERLIVRGAAKVVKQSPQLVKVRLLLPPQHSSNSNLDAGGIAKTVEELSKCMLFFSARL